MRKSMILGLAAVLSVWATQALAAAAPSAAKLTPLPHNFGFVLAVISLIVVGGAAIWLGIGTDMLRDSQPTDFGGAVGAGGKKLRRPYSLAQTQMTWWFCIVLASYLYIAFTTKAGGAPFDIDGGLQESVLILLGIGIGTALGAAMIEQVKTNQGTPTTLDAFQAVVAQLKANPTDAGLIAQRDALAPKVASENLFVDLLTDVNGISLHRFQAFVWTLVLGGMFVFNVLSQDAMPVFNTALLALLGISNGAYLGFKVPETSS